MNIKKTYLHISLTYISLFYTYSYFGMTCFKFASIRFIQIILCIHIKGCVSGHIKFMKACQFEKSCVICSQQIIYMYVSLSYMHRPL